MDSIEKCREYGIDICEGSISGYKIVAAVVVCIILIVLIVNRFGPFSLFLAVFLTIVVAAVTAPQWMEQNALLQAVKNEEPVVTTVTHLGWERYGKRSIEVGYFRYNGKEGYAVNYGSKYGVDVKEGDTICVWTNGHSYVMVRVEEPDIAENAD